MTRILFECDKGVRTLGEVGNSVFEKTGGHAPLPLSPSKDENGAGALDPRESSEPASHIVPLRTHGC